MESFDYRPRTDGVKVEPVRSQRREEVKAIPPFKLSNNVNDKSLEDVSSRLSFISSPPPLHVYEKRLAGSRRRSGEM